MRVILSNCKTLTDKSVGPYQLAFTAYSDFRGKCHISIRFPNFHQEKVNGNDV